MDGFCFVLLFDTVTPLYTTHTLTQTNPKEKKYYHRRSQHESKVQFEGREKNDWNIH